MHNVRLIKAHDLSTICKVLSSVQLHERCTNFLHKITRRVALGVNDKRFISKPTTLSRD